MKRQFKVINRVSRKELIFNIKELREFLDTEMMFVL